MSDLEDAAFCPNSATKKVKSFSAEGEDVYALA